MSCGKITWVLGEHVTGKQPYVKEHPWSWAWGEDFPLDEFFVDTVKPIQHLWCEMLQNDQISRLLKSGYPHHPFLDGIFHEIDHPAMGVPPFSGTPQIDMAFLLEHPCINPHLLIIS